jgi:hypothetical protein
MHGLKIFAFITHRDGGIQTADFRRKRIHTGFTANHPRSKLFAILNHENTVVRQATDHAIGPVNDQGPAGMLQVF